MLALKKKSQQKHHQLPPFNHGDHIHIHDSKTCSRKRKIIEYLKQARSYLIQMENGRKLRRNRRHLSVPRNQELPLSPYLQISNRTTPLTAEHQAGVVKQAVQTKAIFKLIFK